MHVAHKLIRYPGSPTSSFFPFFSLTYLSLRLSSFVTGYKTTRDTKLRNTVTVSLSLSRPQLYFDSNLTGKITDICVCVSIGRVITVDASGSMCIWLIDIDKLTSFQTFTYDSNDDNSIRIPMNTQSNQFLSKTPSISENLDMKLSSSPTVDLVDSTSNTDSLITKPINEKNVIVPILNTERVIKVDSQRVVLLDVMEHNASLNKEIDQGYSLSRSLCLKHFLFLLVICCFHLLNFLRSLR